MMGEDEPGTLARLQALRRELLHPKAAEYGGRIVKTTGDGELVEFARVVDAIECAVSIYPLDACAGRAGAEGAHGRSRVVEREGNCPVA